MDKKIISETRKWIVLIIRNYEPKDLEEIIRLFKKTIFEINIADYDLAQVERSEERRVGKECRL